MPHLHLEYSANVPEPPAMPALFAELHRALAATEAVPLADLKSRAVCCPVSYVGDGAPERSFVCLSLRLLAGRDVSVRQRLVQVCVGVLARHFAAAQRSGACQMSVEVCEMERSTYCKQWP